MTAIGGAALLATGATAQSSSTPRIDKIANQRLSGTYYARHSGMAYDECVRLCLRDSQCLAIEHHRGGGVVFGRNMYCKLFSEPGAARSSNTTDIGYKRSGPAQPNGAATADAKKKADEAKRAEDTKRADDSKKMADAKAAEEARRATEAKRIAEAKSAEDARKAAEARAAEDRRIAEARRIEAERSLKQPGTGGSPPPVAVPAPSPSPPTARPPSSPPPPPVATVPPPPPTAKPTPEPDTGRPRSITPAPTGTGSAQAEWDVVPVFYGTDRNQRSLTTKQGTRIAYGSDRANRVELGRALVTVPKIHQVPKLERPWKVTVPFVDWTLYEEAEDPRKHFTVQEIRAFSKAELLALVRERLGASSNFRNQALVMIHGYNNDFDYALYRSAQITYDLAFDGASFLYSWPSGGGVAQYLYDLNSAAQAEPWLTQFLEMVLAETGAERVNLLAHSMGSNLLMQVLRHMKTRNPAVASRINQIVLAAPDVDLDTFTWLAGEIRGFGKGITLYASSNDVALQVSRRFAGDKPRAGDVPSGIGPAVVGGVDTIDISALSTEYFALGHAAYAEKTPLLRDIDLLLRTGQRPPHDRFPIYKKVPTSKGDYWQYPSGN